MPHRRISTGTQTDGNSSVPNSGDDIKVMPPPLKIAKAIPDYTTLKFTYMDYVDLAVTTSNDDTMKRVFLRLNSLFDPVHTDTATATTRDVATANEHKPYGREIWENIYKYYRVLESDVNLTFISGRIHNTDFSPLNAILVGYSPTDDTADAKNYNDWRTMVEGKHTKNTLLSNGHFNGTNYGFVNPTGLPTATTMSFHYSPETWDYHVEPNAEDERWTAMGANPAISHELMVYAGATVPKSVGDFSTLYQVRCYFFISYTAQLREAKHEVIKVNTSTAETQT